MGWSVGKRSGANGDVWGGIWGDIWGAVSFVFFVAMRSAV
jgi:hypothetical protein